jgi:hypothetical protein
VKLIIFLLIISGSIASAGDDDFTTPIMIDGSNGWRQKITDRDSLEVSSWIRSNLLK